MIDIVPRSFALITMIALLCLLVGGGIAGAECYNRWKCGQELTKDISQLNKDYFELCNKANSETCAITVNDQLFLADAADKGETIEDLLARAQSLQRRNQQLFDVYSSKISPGPLDKQDKTYRVLKAQKIALEKLSDNLEKFDLFFAFLSSTSLSDDYEERAKRYYDARDWSRTDDAIERSLAEVEKQKTMKQAFESDLEQPLFQLEAYLNKHRDYLHMVKSVLLERKRGCFSEALVRKATVLSLEMAESFPVEDLYAYWAKILVDLETAKADSILTAESSNGS